MIATFNHLHRKIWDLRSFDAVNLPEVIGTVSPRFAAAAGIRVLDLPIHMPMQGWRIPEALMQFEEIITAARESEERFGSLGDHYAYVTIDQKMVEAGTTQRRPGAHSDAYVEAHGAQIDVTAENRKILRDEHGEVSHTYLCYDALPTEFFRARFPLEEPECESSMKLFDLIASTAPKITYPCGTLLRLDPYVVHRAAVAEVRTERTFVKVSFSKKRYNRAGNTINPLFAYDWDFIVRSGTRNHPWG